MKKSMVPMVLLRNSHSDLPNLVNFLPFHHSFLLCFGEKWCFTVIGSLSAGVYHVFFGVDKVEGVELN